MFNNFKIPALVGGSLFFIWWFFLADIKNETDEALYSRPEYEEDASTIYYDMGRLALARRDYPAAINFFSDAINVRNTMYTAYDALGKTLETIQQPTKALAIYFEALHKNNNFTQLRFLHQKELPNNPINSDLYALSHAKQWQGQSLQGKSIYIYTEASLKETCMFYRFLKKLSTHAERIYFKAPQALLGLIENEKPTNIILINQSTDLKTIECSYHASLLSLPHYLNTTYEKLKRDQHQYLFAQEEEITKVKNSLNQQNFNIGLIWQDTETIPRQEKIPNKPPLSFFYPLATIPNVQLYSLHKNANNKTIIKIFKNNNSLINLPEWTNNLTNLAALISALDLVIGIDSPEIELSGALGKETIMLTPYLTDWRWLQASEEKKLVDHKNLTIYQPVWYKNFTIFQQTIPNKWDDIFTELYTQIKIRAEKNNLTIY